MVCVMADPILDVFFSAGWVSGLAAEQEEDHWPFVIDAVEFLSIWGGSGNNQFFQQGIYPLASALAPYAKYEVPQQEGAMAFVPFHCACSTMLPRSCEIKTDIPCASWVKRYVSAPLEQAIYTQNPVVQRLVLVLIKTFFEQWCGFFAKPIADECVGKQLVFANPFASRLDAYNHFEIVQYIVRVLEQ